MYKFQHDQGPLQWTHADAEHKCKVLQVKDICEGYILEWYWYI